ncbi:TonB-dependent receptor [Marinoscillum sp. MHG1-6]|uniref:TonB-dependent receptor n=1 Tax=Marinoscillum sp. MHG1-6 TaxID=2959627 RepID=UPI00215725F2|nr:TonB-dependent receptor [Marinoscillum sp. MHG1-6]
MTKYLLGRLLMAGTLALLSLAAYAQGTTTASMRGRIVDDQGEALIGATVIAVHEPTGTEWGNITDFDGFYRLPALKVGGPYTITISFVGFETQTKEGIALSLGQAYNLNVVLQESATQLQEVIVSAGVGDAFSGTKTGAETHLGTSKINEIPTVGRSIGDFARFNPQATIEEGGDGLEISIGGMNNRYNAIYIDGAVNNDVFGLAASGTNGGQTGVSPISLDAIEQFTISVAPYDVRQSGFAGGSINAVTRSGTNEFEGSTYYFFRNENLAGKTPFEKGQKDIIEREKLAEFSAQTYGVRVGGPLVKNKAFFFLNAEFQRDETPQPFSFENYNGDITQSDIDGLSNYLKTNYGYNPGSYLNNTAFLNSDKILGRFDFNLGKQHKLTVRHSYTRAENLEARRSSASSIQFKNGSEYVVSTTNSSALELKSMIGNSMSNHLTVGATFVRDDRDPFGDPFPSVFIDDGRGGIFFGSEPFSTANLLHQDIITINDNFELYRGRHTFLIGANAEFYKTLNLFIPFNYGDYSYSTQFGYGVQGTSFLDDFYNNLTVPLYQFSYALNDPRLGDAGDGAAAKFTASQFGLYVQDEFQANEKLRLTLGLRADINIFENTPTNSEFETSAIVTSGTYDLKGAAPGSFIDPQISWSPRLGFNYDVNGDQNVQVRGGVGLFTSRIPLVWPGAAYNNTGLNTGFDFEAAAFGSTTTFNPDALNQTRNIAVGATQPSGSVDMFAKDFKIPQVMKVNLAADAKLPGGIIGTVEGLYSKFVNNVYYQNVNVTIPTTRLEGTPDDRLTGYDDVDGTYGRVLLGSNTNKGYTYNVSTTLSKEFQTGISTSVSYAYGDAWTVYDGTSSQNSSQWRGLHAINGRNFWTQLGRSDFAQGHRILANVTYRKEYLGFMKSTISLIYEGQSGNNYSYVYGDGDELTGEDSRNRELLYIPKDATEIVFGAYDSGLDQVVLADGATSAAQWAALDAFIESDDYLKSKRGEYIERNQNRTPFEHIIDVRVLQDFYIEMENGKRNTLQLSLDIFNFTNLLSKNWGKRYNYDLEDGYTPLNFEGFQTGTNIPVYSFQEFEKNKPYYGDFDDSGVLSSRWQMQLGIRYIFE